MVLDELFKRDVVDILGLDCHEHRGVVSAVDADRVHRVRIGVGAGGEEDPLTTPMLERVVLDGDSRDGVVLEVEPVRSFLMALQRHDMLLAEVGGLLHDMLAGGDGVEDEQRGAVGGQSQDDAWVAAMVDEGLANGPTWSRYRGIDKRKGKVSKASHSYRRHVDVGRLGASGVRSIREVLIVHIHLLIRENSVNASRRGIQHSIQHRWGGRSRGDLAVLEDHRSDGGRGRRRRRRGGTGARGAVGEEGESWHHGAGDGEGADALEVAQNPTPAAADGISTCRATVIKSEAAEATAVWRAERQAVRRGVSGRRWARGSSGGGGEREATWGLRWR